MKKYLRSILFSVAILTAFCGMSVFAADRTVSLANNTWYSQTEGPADMSYSDSTYFKIQVKKTGYLKIQGNGYYSDGSVSSMYFKFLNSKKKVLNDSEGCSSYNGYTSHFAVKKGTYYVAVRGTGAYRLRYSFSAVSEKSGSKQKKAVKIKKGKTIKGLVLYGESNTKCDWYKIVLTKKQKLTFTFGARATGYIRFQIVPASKKVRLYNASGYLRDETNTYQTKDKLPKGTYYVKILKGASAGKTDSGLYTIKWK